MRSALHRQPIRSVLHEGGFLDRQNGAPLPGVATFLFGHFCRTWISSELCAAAIDAPTGEILGAVEFVTAVEEIDDVQNEPRRGDSRGAQHRRDETFRAALKSIMQRS